MVRIGSTGVVAGTTIPSTSGRLTVTGTMPETVTTTFLFVLFEFLKGEIEQVQGLALRALSEQISIQCWKASRKNTINGRLVEKSKTDRFLFKK